MLSSLATSQTSRGLGHVAGNTGSFIGLALERAFPIFPLLVELEHQLPTALIHAHLAIDALQLVGLGLLPYHNWGYVMSGITRALYFFQFPMYDSQVFGSGLGAEEANGGSDGPNSYAGVFAATAVVVAGVLIALAAMWRNVRTDDREIEYKVLSTQLLGLFLQNWVYFIASVALVPIMQNLLSLAFCYYGSGTEARQAELLAAMAAQSSSKGAAAGFSSATAFSSVAEMFASRTLESFSTGFSSSYTPGAANGAPNPFPHSPLSSAMGLSKELFAPIPILVSNATLARLLPPTLAAINGTLAATTAVRPAVTALSNSFYTSMASSINSNTNNNAATGASASSSSSTARFMVSASYRHLLWFPSEGCGVGGAIGGGLGVFSSFGLALCIVGFFAVFPLAFFMNTVVFDVLPTSSHPLAKAHSGFEGAYLLFKLVACVLMHYFLSIGNAQSTTVLFKGSSSVTSPSGIGYFNQPLSNADGAEVAGPMLYHSIFIAICAFGLLCYAAAALPFYKQWTNRVRITALALCVFGAVLSAISHNPSVGHYFRGERSLAEVFGGGEYGGSSLSLPGVTLSTRQRLFFANSTTALPMVPINPLSGRPYYRPYIRDNTTQHHIDVLVFVVGALLTALLAWYFIADLRVSRTFKRCAEDLATEGLVRFRSTHFPRRLPAGEDVFEDFAEIVDDIAATEVLHTDLRVNAALATGDDYYYGGGGGGGGNDEAGVGSAVYHFTSPYVDDIYMSSDVELSTRFLAAFKDITNGSRPLSSSMLAYAAKVYCKGIVKYRSSSSSFFGILLGGGGGARVRLAFSYFLACYAAKGRTALLQLQALRGQESSLSERYHAWRLYSRLANALHVNESVSLEAYSRAKRRHRDALQYISHFWQILVSDEVDRAALSDVTRAVQFAKKEVGEVYVLLLTKFAGHMDLVASFSVFCESMLLNADATAQTLQCLRELREAKKQNAVRGARIRLAEKETLTQLPLETVEEEEDMQAAESTDSIVYASRVLWLMALLVLALLIGCVVVGEVYKGKREAAVDTMLKCGELRSLAAESVVAAQNVVAAAKIMLDEDGSLSISLAEDYTTTPIDPSTSETNNNNNPAAGIDDGSGGQQPVTSSTTAPGGGSSGSGDEAGGSSSHSSGTAANAAAKSPTDLTPAAQALLTAKAELLSLHDDFRSLHNLLLFTDLRPSSQRHADFVRSLKFIPLGDTQTLNYWSMGYLASIAIKDIIVNPLGSVVMATTLSSSSSDGGATTTGSAATTAASGPTTTTATTTTTTTAAPTTTTATPGSGFGATTTESIILANPTNAHTTLEFIIAEFPHAITYAYNRSIDYYSEALVGLERECMIAQVVLLAGVIALSAVGMLLLVYFDRKIDGIRADIFSLFTLIPKRVCRRLHRDARRRVADLEAFFGLATRQKITFLIGSENEAEGQLGASGDGDSPPEDGNPLAGANNATGGGKINVGSSSRNATVGGGKPPLSRNFRAGGSGASRNTDTDGHHGDSSDSSHDSEEAYAMMMNAAAGGVGGSSRHHHHHHHVASSILVSGGRYANGSISGGNAAGNPLQQSVGSRSMNSFTNPSSSYRGGSPQTQMGGPSFALSNTMQIQQQQQQSHHIRAAASSHQSRLEEANTANLQRARANRAFLADAVFHFESIMGWVVFFCSSAAMLVLLVLALTSLDDGIAKGGLERPLQRAAKTEHVAVTELITAARSFIMTGERVYLNAYVDSIAMAPEAEIERTLFMLDVTASEAAVFRDFVQTVDAIKELLRLSVRLAISTYPVPGVRVTLVNTTREWVPNANNATTNGTFVTKRTVYTRSYSSIFPTADTEQNVHAGVSYSSLANITWPSEEGLLFIRVAERLAQIEFRAGLIDGSATDLAKLPEVQLEIAKQTVYSYCFLSMMADINEKIRGLQSLGAVEASRKASVSDASNYAIAAAVLAVVPLAALAYVYGRAVSIGSMRILGHPFAIGTSLFTAAAIIVCCGVAIAPPVIIANTGFLSDAFTKLHEREKVWFQHVEAIINYPRHYLGSRNVLWLYLFRGTIGEDPLTEAQLPVFGLDPFSAMQSASSTILREGRPREGSSSPSSSNALDRGEVDFVWLFNEYAYTISAVGRSSDNAANADQHAASVSLSPADGGWGTSSSPYSSPLTHGNAGGGGSSSSPTSFANLYGFAELTAATTATDEARSIMRRRVQRMQDDIRTYKQLSRIVIALGFSAFTGNSTAYPLTDRERAALAVSDVSFIDKFEWDLVSEVDYAATMAKYYLSTTIWYSNCSYDKNRLSTAEKVRVAVATGFGARARDLVTSLRSSIADCFEWLATAATETHVARWRRAALLLSVSIAFAAAAVGVAVIVAVAAFVGYTRRSSATLQRSGSRAAVERGGGAQDNSNTADGSPASASHQAQPSHLSKHGGPSSASTSYSSHHHHHGNYQQPNAALFRTTTWPMLSYLLIIATAAVLIVLVSVRRDASIEAPRTLTLATERSWLVARSMAYASIVGSDRTMLYRSQKQLEELADLIAVNVPQLYFKEGGLKYYGALTDPTQDRILFARSNYYALSRGVAGAATMTNSFLRNPFVCNASHGARLLERVSAGVGVAYGDTWLRLARQAASALPAQFPNVLIQLEYYYKAVMLGLSLSTERYAEHISDGQNEWHTIILALTIALIALVVIHHGVVVAQYISFLRLEEASARLMLRIIPPEAKESNPHIAAFLESGKLLGMGMGMGMMGSGASPSTSGSGSSSAAAAAAAAAGGVGWGSGGGAGAQRLLGGGASTLSTSNPSPSLYRGGSGFGSTSVGSGGYGFGFGAMVPSASAALTPIPAAVLDPAMLAGLPLDAQITAMSTLPVITIDQMGIIIRFTAAAEAVFGYAAQEVIGRNVSVLMPPEHAAVHDSFLANYRRTRIPHAVGNVSRFKGMRKGGAQFPFELVVKEIKVSEDERYFVGIGKDLSTQVELALQDRLNDDLLDLTSDCVVIIDHYGYIRLANKTVQHIFGYSSAELIGENCKILMTPVDARDHDAYLRRYRETGVKHIVDTTRDVYGQRKNGDVFSISLSVREIKGTMRGEPSQFIGFIRDVSENVLLEQQAHASDVIAAIAPTPIIVLDKRGVFRRFSAAAERLFGYSSDELVRCQMNIRMLLDHSTRENEEVVRAYLGMVPDTRGVVGTTTNIVAVKKGGEKVPIRLSVVEVAGDNSEPIFVINATDITQIQKAEGQLQLLTAMRQWSVIPIVGTNSRGIITSFNAAAEQAFRWPAEEAIGKNCNILMPAPMRDHHSEVMATFHASRSGGDNFNVSIAEHHRQRMTAMHAVEQQQQQHMQMQQQQQQQQQQMQQQQQQGDAGQHPYNQQQQQYQHRNSAFGGSSQGMTMMAGGAAGGGSTPYQPQQAHSQGPLLSDWIRHETAVRRDGSTFPVKITLRELRDPLTLKSEVFAFIEDITETRSTAQKLMVNEALLSLSPIPIIAIDGDGRIELFSAAAEQCFGYSAIEVIGENIVTIMPPELRPRHDSFLQMFHRSAKKVAIDQTLTVTAMRRNGSRFPCEVSVREVRKHRISALGGLVDGGATTTAERLERVKKGEPMEKASFVAYLKEMSQEGQLLEARALGTTVAALSPTPIIQATVKGIITYVNPAACREFQFEPRDLVGKSVKELMDTAIADRHDGYMRAYEARRTDAKRKFEFDRNNYFGAMAPMMFSSGGNNNQSGSHRFESAHNVNSGGGGGYLAAPGGGSGRQSLLTLAMGRSARMSKSFGHSITTNTTATGAVSRSPSVMLRRVPSQGTLMSTGTTGTGTNANENSTTFGSQFAYGGGGGHHQHQHPHAPALLMGPGGRYWREAGEFTWQQVDSYSRTIRSQAKRSDNTRFDAEISISEIPRLSQHEQDGLLAKATGRTATSAITAASAAGSSAAGGGPQHQPMGIGKPGGSATFLGDPHAISGAAYGGQRKPRGSIMTPLGDVDGDTINLSGGGGSSNSDQGGSSSNSRIAAQHRQAAAMASANSNTGGGKQPHHGGPPLAPNSGGKRPPSGGGGGGSQQQQQSGTGVSAWHSNANDLASTVELMAYVRNLDLQRRLEQANETIDVIVNMSIVPIVAIDHQGVIIVFSAAAEAAFEFKAAEVLGNNVKMLMPPEVAEKHDSYLRTYFKTGIRTVIGNVLRHEGLRRSGARFPIEIAVKEIEKAGQRPLFISYLRPVASDTALEQATQLSQTIIAESPIPVVVINRKGVIRTFNAAASHLTGYEREEVVGLNVGVLMTDGDAQYHDTYLKLYAQNGIKTAIDTSRQRTVKARCGRLIEAAVTVKEVVRSSGETLFIGFIHDLTRDLDLQATSIVNDVVANLSPIPLICISEKGTVIKFNAAAERDFRYSAAEVLGQNVKILMPEDAAKKHDGFLARFANNRTLQIQQALAAAASGQHHLMTARNNGAQNANGGVTFLGVEDASVAGGGGSIAAASLARGGAGGGAAAAVAASTVLAAIPTVEFKRLDYGRRRTGEHFPIEIVVREVRGIKGLSRVGGDNGKGLNGKNGGGGGGGSASDLLSALGGGSVFVGFIRDLTSHFETEHYKSLYETVVHISPFPIISITPDGSITDFNSAASEAFRYEFNEVYGKNVKMLMPKEVSDRHDMYLARYHQTGVKTIIDQTREVFARQKGGRRFPARILIKEIKEEDRHYFIANLTDISVTTALEHAWNLNDCIVDMSDTAIACTDPNGTITKFSRVACEVFRCKESDVVGKDLGLLMTEGWRQLWASSFVSWFNHHTAGPALVGIAGGAEGGSGGAQQISGDINPLASGNTLGGSLSTNNNNLNGGSSGNNNNNQQQQQQLRQQQLNSRNNNNHVSPNFSPNFTAQLDGGAGGTRRQRRSNTNNNDLLQNQSQGQQQQQQPPNSDSTNGAGGGGGAFGGAFPAFRTLSQTLRCRRSDNSEFSALITVNEIPRDDKDLNDPLCIMTAGSRQKAQALSDRAVGGFVVSISNNTEQAQGAEEDAVLYATEELAQRSLIVVNGNGLIVRLNSACAALFGYPSKQALLGKNVRQLMPPDVAAAHDNAMRRYLKTGQSHIMGVPRLVLARMRSGQHIQIELLVTRLHTTHDLNAQRRGGGGGGGAATPPPQQHGGEASPMAGAGGGPVGSNSNSGTEHPFSQQQRKGAQSFHRTAAHVAHHTHTGPDNGEGAEEEPASILLLGVIENMHVKEEVSYAPLLGPLALAMSPTPLVVITREGTIVDMNPASLGLFDFSREQAIGRNVGILMPSGFQRQHDRYLAKYRETGEKRAVDGSIMATGETRTGAPVPLRLSVREFQRDRELLFIGALYPLGPVGGGSAHSPSPPRPDTAAGAAGGGGGASSIASPQSPAPSQQQQQVGGGAATNPLLPPSAQQQQQSHQNARTTFVGGANAAAANNNPLRPTFLGGPRLVGVTSPSRGGDGQKKRAASSAASEKRRAKGSGASAEGGDESASNPLRYLDPSASAPNTPMADADEIFTNTPPPNVIASLLSPSSATSPVPASGSKPPTGAKRSASRKEK